MSLINKALKKAQQQRSPQPPRAGAESAPSPAPAYQNNGPSGDSPRGLYALIALGVVFIGACLGVIVILLLTASPEDSQNQERRADIAAVDEVLPLQNSGEPSAAPPPATAPEIAPAAVAPQASAPSQAAADPESVNPEALIRQLREQNAEPQASPNEQLAEEAPTTTAHPTTETQSAPVDATPYEVDTAHLRTPNPEDNPEGAPDPAIIAWLAESTITGVRLGESNRVVLNNRAFQVGETVNYELGIKVRVIQETRILFEDIHGNRYIKRF